MLVARRTGTHANARRLTTALLSRRAWLDPGHLDRRPSRDPQDRVIRWIGWKRKESESCIESACLEVLDPHSELDTSCAAASERVKNGLNEKAAKAVSLNLREEIDMKVSWVVLKASTEHGFRVVALPNH